MPASSLLTPFIGRPLPQFNDPHVGSARPPMVLIHPLSWEAIGEELTGAGATNLASGTYPSANRGLGFPFEIAEHFLVQKVWWVNGTTATTDRADVGVYYEAGGASSNIVKATTTPTIATANVVQEADCTDTLLVPGRYWCVYAQAGVTATPMAFATPAAIMRAAGCAEMASAMSSNVLGTTWTPSAVTGAVFPFFGIAGRTQVA